MNARAPAVPPALAGARTQAAVLWRGMAPRERWALGLGIAVLGVFVLWLVFIAPAWRTLRSAPAELDRLEVQLQQMQALAAEAKTLRGAPTVSPSQASEPLKIATERLGDKASISFQGDRATLTLRGVTGDALRDWLGEARSAARARAVDVQLSRTPQGYAGMVVVTLGAGS
ncbi:MAG TPA: type II secretion system protein GspM [Albitalea sp.]|nr:type II secretion system protein GspM [Albitalea sp.]